MLLLVGKHQNSSCVTWFAHKKSLTLGVFREKEGSDFLYFFLYFSFLNQKRTWKIPPPFPLLVDFLGLTVLVQAPVSTTKELNAPSFARL